jgi:MftR C-terminal domain
VATLHFARLARQASTHSHSQAAIAQAGDPAGDLQARVIATAVWSANRAARDIWVASDAKRDPRQLVNEAFDLLEHGLRQS